MPFIQPVRGNVSPNFGQDRGDHLHNGVDISANCGTPVVAAESGRVSAANYSNTAGNLVHIEHAQGWQSRYFHLQRSVVRVGENVRQGQLIGYVGNTGRSTSCHLHWETRRNGIALNPLTAGGPSASPLPAPTQPTRSSADGEQFLNHNPFADTGAPAPSGIPTEALIVGGVLFVLLLRRLGG